MYTLSICAVHPIKLLNCYNTPSVLVVVLPGDDMGMGKTFTVISFLTALFRTHTIRKVLILCPVSVLDSWNREVSNHCLPHTHVSESIDRWRTGGVYYYGALLLTCCACLIAYFCLHNPTIFSLYLCLQCFCVLQRCGVHMISADVSKGRRETILESVLMGTSKYKKNICVSSYTLTANMISSFARDE